MSRDPHERSDLRAAAGILAGVCIGTLLWLLIAALIAGGAL